MAEESFVCSQCGVELKLKTPSGEGMEFPCPKCGNRMSVGADSAAKDAPPASGAAVLAAMFNNLTPEVAANLVKALNEGGNTPRINPQPETPRQIYGALGCLLPLAALLFFAGVPILVTEQTPALILISLGLAAGIGGMLLMRGNWTRNRAIGIGVVFALFILIGMMRSRDTLQEAYIKPAVKDLLTEFPNLNNLRTDGTAKLRRGRIFPLVLTESGAKVRAEPITPKLDFDFYHKLPTNLRLNQASEPVETVVFLDWWWDQVGTYQNSLTGGTGGAFLGKVRIVVVDRKTRTVIADHTIVSQDKPPERKKTAIAWYSWQPSYNQVIQFLEGLPQE